MVEMTNTTRTRLLQQHDSIRDHLAVALVLAKRHVTGDPVADALTTKLGEIRVAFEVHNDLESTMLEPLLLASGRSGPARLIRMLEEHADEHAAFTAFLALPLDDVARGLPEFVDLIEAHMAAEERTFLSSYVEREIAARGRDETIR